MTTIDLCKILRSNQNSTRHHNKNSMSFFGAEGSFTTTEGSSKPSVHAYSREGFEAAGTATLIAESTAIRSAAKASADAAQAALTTATNRIAAAKTTMNAA